MNVAFRRGMLFALAAIALAVGAAACRDDDADSESSAQQGDVDALTARVQRNEVLLALKTLGDLPLHDMDESIQGGEVGDRFLPNARTAVRYLAITDWPDSLDADASALQGHAAALVRALDDGDVEAAKEPATELHEGWHDFSSAAWLEIGEGLPEEAGVEPHEEEGTPEADGTAAPGATAEGADHQE
jgi:hypothetical protein